MSARGDKVPAGGDRVPDWRLISYEVSAGGDALSEWCGSYEMSSGADEVPAGGDRVPDEGDNVSNA